MDQHLTSEFTIEELVAAMKTLKLGKSSGPDSIHHEFMIHLDDTCLKWFTKLFSTCMEHKKMPTSWKMAKIIVALKPNKPADLPKSYQPISLLSVTYKLLKRLIYNRILPTVESILPEEQAGFRPNRGLLDQVALLTENIEFAFSKNMKVGTVLVDLFAAYGAVWHLGLTHNLPQIIPSKDMVHMIMSMITQQQFTVNIGPDRSRCRTLVNGVPQGSVLSPILFNIYTHDIPQLVSEKYIYADDIALLHCHTQLAAIDKRLSLDLKTLSQYFHNWHLRLNTTKTVCSIFHLANRLSKYELNVSVDGVKIPFEPLPMYLGVTLDCSLTYRKHLQKTAAKVTARCNILKTLATVNTLRTSAVSLCYSVAEYCSPVWSGSVHCTKLDVSLNECMTYKWLHKIDSYGNLTNPFRH